MNYFNNFLCWIPEENSGGTKVYDHICLFYWIIDQPAIKLLQTQINPLEAGWPRTWFSAWIDRYAVEVGKFLDTPESVEKIQTFIDSPKYNINEYVTPPGGWKTFNQFFARHVKPGERNPDSPGDDHVIVSSADSVFDGCWPINHNSEVSFKGVPWKIQVLLNDSKFGHRFNNGQFAHAFLNTTDYHRQHAPVSGTVVEAKVVQGAAYLQASSDDMVGHLDAPDVPPYQFLQARGLIVIDSPIGLVAVLPIGMAQVSSVKLSTHEGAKVKKGDEISYFQFGGSDICYVFEHKSGVQFTAKIGTHYNTGKEIATARRR
ncbi:phosphatidylserine decarboxylase-related protein [Kalaharituber pfeilii]|nr:phosphatidylserine decarboxylase-related protein [Kalaharituber pfeilii]